MPANVRFGHSALEVTNVGFGAWGIGGTAYGITDDAVSLRALESAFEYGIAFFDTADVYGNGHSEQLIARAHGSRRQALVIASKVGFNFYTAGGAPTFDRDYILSCCDKSLERLGTHVIDIYQLHNPSPQVIDGGEALGALLELQAAGKITIPAVSVRTAEDMAHVLKHPEFGGIQVIYNLIDQRPRALGHLAEARAKGVGIIARVPLAYGFLSGKYEVGHKFGPKDHRAGRTDAEVARYLARSARFQQYVDEGIAGSLVELALRFCLSDPAVSTVIPGLKTAEQVQEAVHAVDRGPLPEDVLHDIYSVGLGWAEEDTHQAALAKS